MSLGPFLEFDAWLKEGGGGSGIVPVVVNSILVPRDVVSYG